MRTIIAISLAFAVLLISSFVYAENDQPGPVSAKIDQSNSVNHRQSAVFVGPKVGWLKLPVEESTSSLADTSK